MERLGGSCSSTSIRSKFKVSLPRLVYLTEMNVGQTFDQTITATAQPHIASSFNRLDLQAWIGTSFILTVTAFLPLFANIADVFGRFWAL
jgi:MFS family permease